MALPFPVLTKDYHLNTFIRLQVASPKNKDERAGQINKHTDIKLLPIFRTIGQMLPLEITSESSLNTLENRAALCRHSF